MFHLSHAWSLQKFHNAANSASEALELQVLVFIWVLKHKLLWKINRLLLIIKAEDLTQVLEALFTILIEIFHEALFLHDLWHVLAQGELGSWVFCQPIIAFDNVLQQSRRRLVFDLSNDHVVQNCANS